MKTGGSYKLPGDDGCISDFDLLPDILGACGYQSRHHICCLAHQGGNAITPHMEVSVADFALCAEQTSVTKGGVHPRSIESGSRSSLKAPWVFRTIKLMRSSNTQQHIKI